MSIKFFGQFLLERNVITPQQLLEAVEFQETKNLKFGAYAVLKGYLTNDEVKRVLDEQKRIDMPFGELAVKLKLLTASQVEELLTLQKNDHILLGEALLQKGFLTNDSLQREIEVMQIGATLVVDLQRGIGTRGLDGAAVGAPGRASGRRVFLLEPGSEAA